MSWCWLALLRHPAAAALAAAPVTDRRGGTEMVLAAFPADAQPPDGAVKVDARAVDPGGAPAAASLVLAPPGRWWAFDDPAVADATRRVLAATVVPLLSTLTLGDDRFVGAITAVRDGSTRRLHDDPFGLLFPRRLLDVDGGLLGAMPAPVGPCIQRYGPGNPWPWDRFGT